MPHHPERISGEIIKDRRTVILDKTLTGSDVGVSKEREELQNSQVGGERHQT
jgi:hypothetical protein